MKRDRLMTTFFLLLCFITLSGCSDTSDDRFSKEVIRFLILRFQIFIQV